jgi:hypothetical protein
VSSGRQREISDARGARIASKSGFDANTGAKASSATIAIRRSGRGKHAIAKRTQADDGDPRAGGKALQHIFHFRKVRLLLDLRFIDQHHGNLVANRINALTLDTFQATLIRLQFHRRFAQRTDQDVQQILANRHGSIQFNKDSLTGTGV